jgi:hypothetical protein
VSRNYGFAVVARTFWLVAVAVLVGCASGPLAGLDSQDIVKEKAQRRWDLLVKGDFAGTYGFLSPAGRSVVTQAAYAGSFKPGFWTGARVAKVECPTPELCQVEVAIDYTYSGRKISTVLREKWVKQDSDWWYLLER